MKSFFTSVLIAMMSFIPVVTFAESGSADSASPTIKTEVPLLVESIATQDDMHVLLTFNQSIVTESIRVRITRQSNGNNVKIGSLTGVVDSPKSVSILMNDPLEAGVAYTMIIVSAISDTAVIIRDGADALKEFTTPVPLKSSTPITFNAAASKTTTVSKSPDSTSTTLASADSKKPVISNTTQELPLTGMNPFIFMIIA